DFRERFTLLFNQFTNYHSTDWMRALKLFLILFLFHISLVTTYLKCSDQIDNVADVLRIFHFFISPINFLSELHEYSFPNLIYFLDVLYHLCIGVVIYQFIAAFRKFNK